MKGRKELISIFICLAFLLFLIGAFPGFGSAAAEEIAGGGGCACYGQ